MMGCVSSIFVRWRCQKNLYECIYVGVIIDVSSRPQSSDVEARVRREAPQASGHAVYAGTPSMPVRR